MEVGDRGSGGGVEADGARSARGFERYKEYWLETDNMSSALNYDLKLRQLHDKATGRLLTADFFDEQAFVNLYTYACELAKSYQTEYLIPKQFLAAMLSTISAIESRAEYLPEVRKYLRVANDFDALLGLVSRGEAPDDRRPGVPRVL